MNFNFFHDFSNNESFSRIFTNYIDEEAIFFKERRR